MIENCVYPQTVTVPGNQSGAQQAGSYEARRPEPSKIAPAPESLHILVAEDNAVNQQIARRLLEKRGHTVVVVADGRATLERLQQEQFDLVLMDVQMPIMDGVEATAAIRAREQQTGDWLPVVAMTAHAMKGDREKYLAAGMDGYISKPVQKETLWEVVEDFGRKKRSAKPPTPPEMDKATRSDEHSGQAVAIGQVDASPSGYAVFDRNAALDRVEGDSDLLREMAAVFLENCDAMLDDVRRAAASHDARALERAAHAMKGCLANLAADEAWHASAHVESFGREKNLDRMPEACSQLEQAIGRLRPEMESLLEPVAC
ncbi:MAG TPA: response regulator [Terriglobia bacterium]|nr:response regulator [Terriglobia bacterium]